MYKAASEREEPVVRVRTRSRPAKAYNSSWYLTSNGTLEDVNAGQTGIRYYGPTKAAWKLVPLTERPRWPYEMFRLVCQDCRNHSENGRCQMPCTPADKVQCLLETDASNANGMKTASVVKQAVAPMMLERRGALWLS